MEGMPCNLIRRTRVRCAWGERREEGHRGGSGGSMPTESFQKTFRLSIIQRLRARSYLDSCYGLVHLHLLVRQEGNVQRDELQVRGRGDIEMSSKLLQKPNFFGSTTKYQHYPTKFTNKQKTRTNSLKNKEMRALHADSSYGPFQRTATVEGALNIESKPPSRRRYAGVEFHAQFGERAAQRGALLV